MYVIRLALAGLMLILDYGSSLRCYKCSSSETPDCSFKPAGPGILRVECHKDENSNFGAYLVKNGVTMGSTAPEPRAPQYCVIVKFKSGLIIRSCIQMLEAAKGDFGALCDVLTTAAGSSEAASNQSSLSYCRVCHTDLCNKSGVAGLAASLALAAAAATLAYFGSQ